MYTVVRMFVFFPVRGRGSSVDFCLPHCVGEINWQCVSQLFYDNTLVANHVAHTYAVGTITPSLYKPV